MACAGEWKLTGGACGSTQSQGPAHVGCSLAGDVVTPRGLQFSTP